MDMLAWLYVELALSVHDTVPDNDRQYCDAGERKARNPYGIVEIGLEPHLNRYVDLIIAARHESSLDTGTDWGDNSIKVGLRINFK